MTKAPGLGNKAGFVLCQLLASEQPADRQAATAALAVASSADGQGVLSAVFDLLSGSIEGVQSNRTALWNVVERGVRELKSEEQQIAFGEQISRVLGGLDVQESRTAMRLLGRLPHFRSRDGRAAVVEMLISAADLPATFSGSDEDFAKFNACAKNCGQQFRRGASSDTLVEYAIANVVPKLAEAT